ncbi:MAG: DUF2520 domain-containing protein [Candidatus Marinimicrobia bacterium]|nr:DUF2520 domain-containing protein [Candidatus Neomarinimicrobiota bacterium]
MGRAHYSFGLIGASKVGISLSWHLQNKGHKPRFLWNRSKEGWHRGRKFLKFHYYTREFNSLSDVELFIISVTDDAIEEVAWNLAEASEDLTDKIIFHTSGFHSSEILRPLRLRGAKIGSLHPAVSISNIKAGIEVIPETVFTCEGDAQNELKAIADQIGKKGTIISAEQKQYLHLSAVFVNNYVTALITALKNMMQQKGISPQDSKGLLQKLSQQATESWGQSIKESLTGPIVRGDINTIKGHLKLLENYPDLEELYIKFANLAVDLYPEKLKEINETVETNK